MLVSSLFLLLMVVRGIQGHGRLTEPPSRSTMWRYGFNTPPNYNDHESYCGGFTRQWQTNQGRCGICGDAWDEPQPRANEAGGRYGQGVIARKYTKGQDIKVRIQLTANHMGHFEFRLCPNNNPSKPATQTCLDRYLLNQTNGRGPNYYPGPGNRVFETMYKLPDSLTCTQCVFQWKYIAANNWGTCSNGTGKVGCGPQEEFRACSDVVVTEVDGTADSGHNQDIDLFENLPDKQEVEVDWEEEEKEEEEEQHHREGRGVESVVIIVLASLLTATFMFGLIFLYYYKARDPVKAFMRRKDLSFSSLPNLPRLKSSHRMRYLCKPLGKLEWPLSNISLPSSLPSFLHKTPVQSIQATTDSPPIPPPRTKRSRSRTVSPSSLAPRLATIVPRRPHPRPPGPPGPPPSAAPRSPVPVLEISAPTEVTINGVTVSSTCVSPMSQTAAVGPTPSSRGVLCGVSPPPGPGSSQSRYSSVSSASILSSSSSVISESSESSSSSSSGLRVARPAIVLADLPDSSIESSIPQSDVAPPLPSCPPPDSICLDPDNSSTDA